MLKENKELDVKQTLSFQRKNKFLLLVIFILISISSVWVIIANNKNFSLKAFKNFILDSSPIWIILAFFSIFMYIWFEGKAIMCICKELGYKSKKRNGFVYSSADIYFSAITPSSSGGQPASAYFMIKDGIPAAVVTISLLYNTLMYSVSILLINIIFLMIKPSIFLSFNILSKFIIIGGFITQAGLIVIFYCLLYKNSFLYSLCNFILKILAKLHFVKNYEKKLEKLKEIMNKYQECAKILRGKKKLIFKNLLFNVLQRIFQIAIVVFVFLATNKSSNEIYSIFAIESLVILGAYCIPIPGAIGVTDYLMINGFGQIIPWDCAINLGLFSRAISFYCCVIICGITVAVKYFLIKRSSKK